MRYLPPAITDLKNKQDIEPRTGIDLISINKYLTYQEPFYSKLTTGILGDVAVASPDNYTFTPNSWDSDWDAYDGESYGWYLIDSDASHAYRIDEFDKTNQWITTLDIMPTGTPTYYIAKYYVSRLHSAPVVESSMNRTGALMQTNTVNFEIDNPEEDDNLTGVYNWNTTNILELGSGGPLNFDYIGRMIRVAHATGYVLEAVITDIDATLTYVTFDRDLQYYADEIYSAEIIHQTFFSDIFRTTPTIEDTQCIIRQFLGDNQDVFNQTDSILLMDGKIKSVGDLAQDVLPITVYDTEKYLEENIIGELISDSDTYVGTQNPPDVLGKMKPILFGHFDNYSVRGTYYEPTDPPSRLAKCIYLGVRDVSGTWYAEYLVANHALSSFTTLYLKNEAGRYNRIYDTLTETTIGGDTVIRVPVYQTTTERYILLEDNYYSNGETTEVSGSGFANLDQAANNDPIDAGTCSLDSITPGSYAGTFSVNFNDYDLDIVDADVVSVSPYATIKVDTTGSIDPSAFVNVNGTAYSQLFWNSAKSNNPFGSDAASLSGISENIEIASDIPVLSSMTLVTSIYMAMKVIRYHLHVDKLTDLEVYAACRGAEYGTWINNRTENYTNLNGGYYHYAHADTGESGLIIENPVGVLEWILREVKGKTNSDIDIDSFNRASIARSSWKADYIITEQVESESFLQQFLDEFCLNLGETEDGLIRVIAYDPNAPFTNNNMIFDDARLVADSNILDGSTDFEIEFKFKLTSYSTNANIIFGSTQLATGDYGAIGCDASNIRVTLDTGASVTTLTFAYTINLDTDYTVSVKKISDTVFVTVDGVETTRTTTAGYTLSFDQFGAIRTFLAGYNFNGTLYYAKIWSGGDRDTGTLVCDLEAINEKFVDKTGTHYFTKDVSGAGDITFELSKEGIYDYHAPAIDGEYKHLPIIINKEAGSNPQDLPKFPKDDTQLFTKLVQNYNKSYISGNYQESYPDTDTTYVSRTITKTVSLDFIADDTTIQTRATLMLLLYDQLPRLAQFYSSSASLHHEKGDIVNIWSPVLNNGIYTTSTMKAKKWFVLNKIYNTQLQKYNIGLCELL